MPPTSHPAKPATRIALVTVPVIVALGFLSGRLANSGFGNDWFDALAKPGAMPPGWVFGAAWTILYILLGIVLAIVMAAPRSRTRAKALALFLVQMGLNLCWSPLFFGAHQVELGLGTIIVILLFSLAATKSVADISRATAWLMVPYLAWLSFAAYLNFEIWRLNPAA